MRNENNPNKFIATTCEGIICNPNEVIFPILKQLEDDRWELIGTGFFITRNGIFLTAKHVLTDVLNDIQTQIYPIVAVVFPSPGICQFRKILKGFLNVPGDIAAGLIDMTNSAGELLNNPYYGLYCNQVKVDEKIHTYAYPKTKCARNKIDFHADYYEGKIVKHYPNGRDSTLLPNSCYQTTINILHGASGGPVFNSSGSVIGINSTGYDFDNNQPPISFISDVSQAFNIILEDITLPCGYRKKCTIDELHHLGYVSTNTLIKNPK